jgi:hypothetical protein
MVSSDMARVEHAFGPVIRDLVAGGHAAQLGGLVGRAVDGQTLGPLPVDPGATDPEQVRSTAGFVQDRLLECRTASGASVVWPTCRPGHHHPRELTAAGPGWPAWTCPLEPGAKVPVGKLSGAPVK